MNINFHPALRTKLFAAFDKITKARLKASYSKPETSGLVTSPDYRSGDVLLIRRKGRFSS